MYGKHGIVFFCLSTNFTNFIYRRTGVSPVLFLFFAGNSKASEMLHIRNPMRSEQREQSLGTKSSAQTAPRERRIRSLTPSRRNGTSSNRSVLTEPPSHRVFIYRRTGVSPVPFLFFEDNSTHRRCFTSVTPCGASNASGAWGQVLRPNRAAGTTHSLPDSLAAQWNKLESLRSHRVTKPQRFYL